MFIDQNDAALIEGAYVLIREFECLVTCSPSCYRLDVESPGFMLDG
jgi:hypothetical protein